jgi:hypothetical protein
MLMTNAKLRGGFLRATLPLLFLVLSPTASHVAASLNAREQLQSPARLPSAPSRELSFGLTTYAAA